MTSKTILYLMFGVFGMCLCQEGSAFEPTRTLSIATGRGNIFRPSYAIGIPRFFYNGFQPYQFMNKRSMSSAVPAKFMSLAGEDSELDNDLQFMKRSAALGRTRFRPGKRSLVTMEELEDMGMLPGFSLLTEAQMGKRSMAVGRVGFRPGKRSIATGRAGALFWNPNYAKAAVISQRGFRPGKRSLTFSENADSWEQMNMVERLTDN
ncbi:Neuropeptide-Like Protein [Ditylenchus destructor]|uniref:Neuropeptide-Like Protein n=1 Tax=Ditylenchus destructor TaxID=166010 RepID=A0AAD4R258_9BILA|nr:Neuropeptide-Like Protein [Ditylenchus destructor]